jgi:cyclopropane fatty-acyl-phospholipid synthase-like methyltransferase
MEIDFKKQIIDYYEQTDKSYQHWGEEEIYSMHYGFWNENTKSHVEALNNMNRVLAEKLKIKESDKILDAGCGVGASAIWLAKNYNVEVTGITISNLQCEKANKFSLREGLSGRVKFFIQDFTKTNFPNESFDIIFAIESVCHAENKKEFLEEAYRILKKNGKLIVVDGFMDKDKIGFLDNFLLNSWIKGWKVPNLAKAIDFQLYLENIGFKNIGFKNINKNILPSSKEIFKRGILGWPIYKLKRKKTIQMDHVKGCVFQYLALKNNAWIYGIFYAEK